MVKKRKLIKKKKTYKKLKSKLFTDSVHKCFGKEERKKKREK